jgi:protein-S-isoprenylcysteine O-methyltransferase Ste14
MLGLIYSLFSYAGFLAVFTYFALFSDGILVPLHVDTGEPAGLVTALAVDLTLLLVFGLQHSIMAREGFKRVWTRLIPPHLERATYVLASSLALGLVMWQWRALPARVWSVESAPAAALLWCVNALGWLGGTLSTFLIDHLDLFGIKQAFHAFRRSSYQRRGFVTPLVYKYMRHPLMTGLLIGFWVTPHMSLGHLVLALGMSAYILIGVHFEERSLVRALGADYARYRASTPRFLPLPRSKPREKEGTQASTGAARALRDTPPLRP